jgi:hypothetical protein
MRNIFLFNTSFNFAGKSDVDWALVGALHIDNTRVAEDWLDDDQVSALNTGGNGPVTRNEVTRAASENLFPTRFLTFSF